MGDFWHMTWEETSDMGAFISAENIYNTYMLPVEKDASCRAKMEVITILMDSKG